MAGGVKTQAINFVLKYPVQTYLGLGAAIMIKRQVENRQTFNYWFGAFETQRRIERGRIWTDRQHHSTRVEKVTTTFAVIIWEWHYSFFG